MILEVPLNVLSHLYLGTITHKKRGGKPPLISKPYGYYAEVVALITANPITGAAADWATAV